MSKSNFIRARPFNGRLFASAQIVSFVLFIGVYGASSSAYAEESSRREYAVKGAFLFNFSKFITWPTSKKRGSTFVLGIVGNDPFGKALDRNLAGRSIGGRAVKVERLKDTDAFDHVDVLFVGLARKARRRKLLKRLERAPILTVGEAPEFCGEGGVIRFVMVDKKVRFEINRAVAKKKKLVINVELLKLAQKPTAKKGAKK